MFQLVKKDSEFSQQEFWLPVHTLCHLATGDSCKVGPIVNNKIIYFLVYCYLRNDSNEMENFHPGNCPYCPDRQSRVYKACIRRSYIAESFFFFFFQAMKNLAVDVDFMFH